MSLARMGPSAKEAIPSLKKLGNGATLRMVLANIGDDAKPSTKAIRDWLKEPGGDDYPFDMLLNVRPGEWLTREIADDLFKFVGKVEEEDLQRGDALLMAARIFGLMGERAASAIPFLERAQKATIKNPSTVAIVVTLALARIDPKNQDAILRRLFKGIPQAFRVLERTTMSILTENPYLFVDSRMSLLLAEMVEDKDAAVAEGASALLWWAGLAGKDAFPRLLKYVSGDAAPARRAVAANVLGRVATFDRLAAMEAALKEEKSVSVRQELEAALKDIRSLGKEAWHEEYLSRRYPLNLLP